MIEELAQGEFSSKSVSLPKIWKADYQGDPTKPIYEFEAWVSTEAIDRDGEIIRADGWRKPSLQSPKLLLFHDAWDFPIGKPYWTKVKEEEGKRGLYSRGRFGPQLVGMAVGELYLNGDMDSFSVGFEWFKRIFNDQADGVKTAYYEYIDQELYEYSAVTIPANPQAVIATQQLLLDAGDLKDMMSIIKGLSEQQLTRKAQERESYVIKSSVIQKLEERIERLEKRENVYNASEYEGVNNIDLDEIDVEVEADALDGDGDTSSDAEVLVEVGDGAGIDVEI